MGKIIAIAGKGGVGKTTLCGLLIQHLCRTGRTPVLAVDADANSNLNEVLGVEAPPTLGEIREEIERDGTNHVVPAGMTKANYLEMRISDAITEEDNFDLMVIPCFYRLLQGCHHRQPSIRRDLNGTAFYRDHFNVVFRNFICCCSRRTAAGHDDLGQTFSRDRHNCFSRFPHTHAGMGLLSGSESNHGWVKRQVAGKADGGKIGGSILVFRADQHERIG